MYMRIKREGRLLDSRVRRPMMTSDLIDVLLSDVGRRRNIYLPITIYLPAFQ